MMTKHVKFSALRDVIIVPDENNGKHISDCAKHVPCEIKFISSEVKKRRREAYERAIGMVRDLEASLTVFNQHAEKATTTAKREFYMEQADEAKFHLDLWKMKLYHVDFRQYKIILAKSSIVAVLKYYICIMY